MSKQTEALKLALEALENTSPLGFNMESDKRFYAAITAIREALAEQLAPAPEVREQQEPVDFASLLNEAKEIVRAKPVWKRFIDGTPLSNDIAVWMTVFAQDVSRRTSPPASKPWVGLTEQEHTDIAIQCGCMSADWVFYGATVERILKEKNS